MVDPVVGDPVSGDPVVGDPVVSVVIGVRNGAGSLERTLRSVLEQEGVNLELIVVDDGSDDGTEALVARLAAAEPRIRSLRLPGEGLTAALIAGCRLARGRYIARQDDGDISLPGRLRRQVDTLEADPGAVLCSCHTRLVVAEGPTITLIKPRQADLADGISRAPHHGSVMMRREACERVGGYRRCFHYAQDVDLWSRLAEIGEHALIPEVLYEARIDPGSISGMRRREQEAFHALIVEATRARRQGRDEAPWLQQAEALSQRCRHTQGRSARLMAAGAYFIGASLIGESPELARRYLRRALELNPLHWRARWRLARLR